MNMKEFESLLLAEKTELERSLKATGMSDPAHQEETDTVRPNMNLDPADKMDVADELEEYETDVTINATLDSQYENVLAALERIKEGTYGTCEVGGEMMNEERLRANPAARTCVEHSQ
ncbi:MAG: TraR/DksA C4-type zinc finger protein [Patescibacteria group bacterium]